MVALPLALTFLRLVLGPVAIIVASQSYDKQLFVPILIGAILSDYFDGVLARKLNVAFPWVRRLDSITDALFYLCILVSAWMVAHSTIVAGIIPVSGLVLGELVCNGLSLVKFRVLPATHTISAKFYGLCLFIACLCVIAYGVGPWILWALAGVSIMANAEVVALLLLSKEAPVDVLSIFHFRRKQANPQGGVNGSQPFSSETNRTSATAASRRSP